MAGAAEGAGARVGAEGTAEAGGGARLGEAALASQESQDRGAALEPQPLAVVAELGLGAVLVAGRLAAAGAAPGGEGLAAAPQARVESAVRVQSMTSTKVRLPTR